MRFTILEAILSNQDDEKRARDFVSLLQDVLLTTDGPTIEKKFVEELLEEYGFPRYPDES